MRKFISENWLVLGVLAILLCGGLLFLPIGLAMLYVLRQRHEEIQKGELEDAKKY